jgi:glycosyltransferase involved in cell wall biosynthesis
MLLCVIHDLKIILKNFFKKKTLNKSTSGFVEQSLEKNFKVIELPYFITIFFSNILNTFFDGVFINWKFTNLRDDKNLERKLLKLCKKIKNKKVLIDTRDTSNEYSSDIIHSFDLIVQREKLKKLKNLKIFSSMLPCTLLDSAKYDEPINWNLIGKSEPNDKFKFDIFFSGKKTSQARVDLLKTIETLNLSYAGGLGNKILHNDYLEMIYKSAINLAPEGVGIFTFRHLEIIACCSFLMCPSKINEIELPIPLRDGEDFVGYDDLNDFKEKIDYYLKNPKIRKQIAMNGRKKMEKHYSPLNHGKNIYNKLFKI